MAEIVKFGFGLHDVELPVVRLISATYGLLSPPIESKLPPTYTVPVPNSMASTEPNDCTFGFQLVLVPKFMESIIEVSTAANFEREELAN